MATQTPPSSQPPTRKHSLHYILSPHSLAQTAPDVPGIKSPSENPASVAPSCPVTPPRPGGLLSLPPDILGRIAYHVVVDDDGHAGRPSLLLPLLYTSHTINKAIKFDNNPVLYNRLFRATFDLGALIRRTQWMFDVNTDVPGTSRKTELFGNPRSWAIEYRNRWELRKRMRACIAHQSLHVPGVSSREHLDTDMWALWFLWTENDSKNLTFLTDECWFHEWILCYYRDDMLKDSLKAGYPKDSAEKALGCWIAILSGSDLFGERSAQEIDDKIYMLRPYVFAPHYELMYAKWEHRRLPLCNPGCTEHPPISGRAAPYKRFGHQHMRAPPHFVLGAILCFIRLLDRQPARVGLKQGSTGFQGDVGRGLFSVTHIMPSLYHDTEWQRNTVCQDPHTSPGLPPLTFHGRLQGFWRGYLLFFDFESYRQALAGNMRTLYTGTFAQHAVELEIQETVIRVRLEDVGGKGSLLNCGFADEETEEEQVRILNGYGHEVLTGDAVYARETPGWTKEILLSGGCRSAWGWSRIRGRIRAWDGLVTLSIGAAHPFPCGQWVWRGYIHTGGYWIGRWRDCFANENARGYEGPFGLVRAGDLFYPRHFPTSMKSSMGISKLDMGNTTTIPGPAPGGVDHFRPISTPVSAHSSHSSRHNSNNSNHSNHSNHSHHSHHSNYSNHSNPTGPVNHVNHANHSRHSVYPTYSRRGSAHGSAHGSGSGYGSSRGSRAASPRSMDEHERGSPRDPYDRDRARPTSGPKRKSTDEYDQDDYYREREYRDREMLERERAEREYRERERAEREREYRERHERAYRERSEREYREQSEREYRERSERDYRAWSDRDYRDRYDYHESGRHPQR